jgi:D-alanine-D-alanine ligase
VKPLDSGSSVGVSIIRKKEDIAGAVEEALKDSEQVLVEAYVSGKEFTVAVIDEEKKTVALPVVEIRPVHEFFDKESKYDEDLCEEICPAQIDDGLARRLQAIAVRAHRMIQAKHISRSDFIVDRHGEIWFLEINTIPGLTENSLTPKAIRASDRDLGTLLLSWIESVAKEKTRG